MSETAPRLHPDTSVLAAFVEGNVTGAELRAVADHLKTCEECRMIAGTAAGFLREEQPLRPPRRVTRWWMLAAAAAVIVVFGAIAFSRLNDPLQRLQPRGNRNYQVRLAEFAYAPYRVMRSEIGPDYRQYGAVGDLKERAENDPSARNLQRYGAALIMIGKPADAVAQLQRAMSLDGADVTILSDLSAAEYQAGRYGDSAKYAGAALKTNKTCLPALFNYALALEAFGPAKTSAEAWRNYLAADPNSEWAQEAKTHLNALEKPRADFPKALDRVYASQRRVEDARKLAAEFPLESRTWTEGEILARWGEAVQRGDVAKAAEHLDVAFAIASAVAERSGERLALDAVNAAKIAEHPLAEAHVLYRTGRIAQSLKKPGEAEPSLTRAAELFERGHSPMALVARYYAANTVFDQNRIAEAQRTLEDLAARVPPQYRALNAHIRWEEGLCLIATGRFRAALDTLAQSGALFAANGESDNQAAVLSLSADAHASLGDFEKGREERERALRMLRFADVRRLVSPLMGASSAAAREGDLLLARSFLTIEVQTTEQVRSAQQAHADALLRRALLALRSSDRPSAEEDLRRVAAIIGGMSDAAIKARVEADHEYVEAVALIDQRPLEAAQLASASLDFHRQRGRAVYLPDLYLARAKARQRSGDLDGARSDLAAGIEEVERLRKESPAGAARWGIFDPAADLFASAIDLDLETGQTEDAWRVADRSRARALLDRFGSEQPVLDRADIPTDTTIIEFAAVNGRIVTFVVTHDDLLVLHKSRVTWQTTIEPIPARMRRMQFVFIPTGELHLIPFSAFRNPSTGRYLVEDHEVVVAPSAATYLALVKTAPARPGSALIVSSPRRTDEPELPAAIDEARSIGGLYRHATLLSGADATRERLMAQAAEADVIHFAGHGADRGAILLANGTNLNEEDIASQNLPRHPVVVLAACGTARGPIQSAEGPLSVARGFLAAGVRSVIATLSPVDDAESARFFIRLHEHLSRGERPSAAVRATQIEFIRQHTAVWSAVETIGS